METKKMMKKKTPSRKEYGPAEGARMIAGLRRAAEKVYREEFEKMFVDPKDKNAARR